MAKTLLLADDSVTIQKVVGISFANEDIDITTVDNGHDAIARARELVPDVVLADVVMPGLSGYEVCETIKSDPALQHIPVILLTGTFEAFDAERAERAGAAGHVSKPFEAQTLVDRVKELLASAPAPRPAAAAPAFEFSDDGSELSELPLDGAESEPLDFDDSDAAFSFDDDLPSTADDLGAAPLPDATVLLPKPPAVPVEERDLTRATLLDPAAARGFDVSSSDLGPPPLSAADPVLARLQSPRAEPPGPDAPRPYGAGPDPADGAESGISPAGEPLEAEPMELSDLEPEADAWRAPGAALDDGAPQDPGALTDPFPGWGEPDSEAEPAQPEQAAAFDPDPEPEPAAAFDPDPEPEPAAAFEPAALTPALRQELSDTLEKIAWDAFGPVTEKIVQQALERLEQVVWEVVPQLAETLIRDEIRRLKGGDGGD